MMSAKLIFNPRNAQKTAKSIRRVKIVVGVLKGAMRDVDNGETEKSVPVAPYAAMNEFGTEHIPPRPFLRNSIDAHGDEWRQLIAAGIRARGVGRVESVLQDVGHALVADVQQTIRDGHFTELAEKTKKAKKRKGRPEPSAPLIDTASLIKSIAFEVRHESS